MKNIRLLSYCALMLSAFFCGTQVQAQVISTVAGGTTPVGFPPPAPAEGVAATATTTYLSAPYGIVMDNAGNLLIADQTNALVRKVDPSTGIITAVAGTWALAAPSDAGDGGPATAAACRLNAPVDVGVDASGNIYIAENGGNRVRMVDHISGNITTIAGGGTAVAAPYGDGGPATTATFGGCRGIVVDPSGSPIYVSDGSHNRVRVLTYSAGPGSPYNVNNYVGTGATGALPYGDGGPATAANLSAPRGLFLDPTTGDLYIADMGSGGTGHNRIRKVDATTGLISTVAGSVTAGGYAGDGGPATAVAARLDLPTDVVLNAAGDMYIADASGNRVRFVDHTTGNISTIVNTAGTTGATPYGDGGPATAANLSVGISIALDGASGNYYISDQSHNRIRYVDLSAVANTAPTFVGGASQNLTPICENSGAVSLNTILAVNDADAGNTETWSMVTGSGPAHGTAVVAYTTTSTGSTMTPTGLTYTPTPGYSGTDVFTVKVSDGVATPATTTVIHVTVNPLPAITGISGSASSVCVGSSIVFTDATTGGTWAVSNANASVVGGTVTGAVAGTDVIYYIATNGCGSDSVSTIVTINAVSAPSVAIASTLGTSTCGVPGTFTATPTGGGAAPTYQWSVAGSAITGATNDNYTYTPTAGDVVSVTMHSSSACSTPSTATNSITMTAGGTVVPTITITTGVGDTVCVGVPVTLTATTTNAGTSPSYNWMVNGVSMGSGSTYVYTATAGSAGDVIACVLTSSIPCASPTTATSNDIHISLRASGAATLSITAYPGNIVCAETHVTFTASETGGGTAPLLRWTRAGVNVATGPTYTTIPNDGDAVFCVMHSSIACSLSDSVISNIIGMTVEPVVTPVVVVTSTKSTAGVGEAVTFTATVTSPTLSPSYQWYLNGEPIPGATSSHYVYTGTSTGSAIINCAVSSGDACNAVGVSNLFTVAISGVGVKQVGAASTEMKLVPNPSKGVFSMTLASGYNDQVTVVITNILGEKVKEFTTTTNNTTEITLNQATGIYFLSATTDHGNYVAKVMVN